MQKAVLITLGSCLVVAIATAVIFFVELKRVEDERNNLMTQVEQLDSQVKDVRAAREREGVTAKATQAELSDKISQMDQTIKDQESQLKELGSFKASIEQVKFLNGDNKEWRAALEDQSQLVAYLSDKLKDTDMTVYRQDPYVVVQVPQATFQLGSARSSKKLQESLKVIADTFNSYKGSYLLAVEGHTDNTPTKDNGTYASNWDLGAKRADKVVQALLALGIDPSNVSLVSRSQYMPINAYELPTPDEKNRRIEIVFAPRRMVVKDKPSVYINQELQTPAAATPAVQPVAP